MGQVRHGSATTTHTIRAAIQRSIARQGIALQCPERGKLWCATSPWGRKVSRSRDRTKPERIPPSKPRRDKDALQEDALQKDCWPAAMARDFDHQVAELKVRIAVLNGYTTLGIPVTEAAE